MLTDHIVIKFFGLEWKVVKGFDEFSHGRTKDYDHSGWYLGSTLICGVRENLLDSQCLVKLLPSIVEKLVCLEERKNQN